MRGIDFLGVFLEEIESELGTIPSDLIYKIFE